MNPASLFESPEYWNDRYFNNNDTWSLNSANPVFVQLLKEEKFSFGRKMLILGSGTGRDAITASELGFDVTGIDFSSEAVKTAEDNSRHIKNPPVFFQQDIFELKSTDSQYDVIYEYVVFCSVVPSRIDEMLANVHNITAQNGYLISVLFPVNKLNYAPPNEIDYVEFVKNAAKYFRLIYYQKNINSIKPRKGNEVLLIFKNSG